MAAPVLATNRVTTWHETNSEKLKRPGILTGREFTVYIYCCAIRDRETYLDSITPPEWQTPSEEREILIRETREEIDAMKARLEAARNKK